MIDQPTPLDEEQEAPAYVPPRGEWPDADRVLHRRLRAIAGHDHAYILIRLPIPGGAGQLDISEELTTDMLPAIFHTLAVAVDQ